MAGSEAVPSATDPETPPGPATASLLSRMRVTIVMAILSAVFLAAFLGSWQVQRLISSDARHDGAIDDATKKDKKPPEAHVELAHADRGLREQRFAEAIATYQAIAGSTPTLVPLLQYRIGLCHESLGQTEQAMAAYRNAMGTTSARPLAVACRARVAACLFKRQQPSDARRLLAGLLLDESTQYAIPRELLAEARHLYALSLSQHSATTQGSEKKRNAFVSFAEMATEVPHYLDEIPSVPKVNEALLFGPPMPPILVRAKTKTEPAIVLNVDESERSAQALLRQMIERAGMKSEWTVSAQRIADAQAIRVNLQDWDLIDLVEVMADSLELVCDFGEHTVWFSSEEEADPAKAIAFRREFARRSLARAIASDPQHALAAASHVELGTCLASAGKLTDAVSAYTAVIKETPGSPYAVLARYNRAQSQLQMRSFAEARKDFFGVADQSPGSEFAVRAMIRLGQLFLEEGNARDAVSVLRRAEKLSPNSPHQASAALQSAIACVADRKPEDARKVLERNRRALQPPSYRAAAAFVDAYARSLATRGTDAHRRDAADVIGTLLHLSDVSVLGPFGICIVADACDEMGFPEESERLLRKAVLDPYSPMTPMIELKLGQALLKQDQREPAQRLFEKLLDEPARIRSQARFELARLDLMERRWPGCIEQCEQLWKEHAPVDRASLLRLWGSALEGAGDYTKAAACFSGKAPL